MDRRSTNLYKLHDNTKKDFNCFRNRAVEFEDSAKATKVFIENMKSVMSNRGPPLESQS